MLERYCRNNFLFTKIKKQKHEGFCNDWPSEITLIIYIHFDLFCKSAIPHALQQACDILVVLSYLVLSAKFRRRFVGLVHPLRCRPPAQPALTPSTLQNDSFAQSTQVELASVTRS